MSTHLHGLYLQYYRGIGSDAQSLGPFQKFNFFIGANNAGKSIVLNYLATHLSAQATTLPPNLAALEEYRGKKTGPRNVGIGLLPQNFIAASIAGWPEGYRDPDAPLIERIAMALTKEGLIWVMPEASHGTRSLLAPPEELIQTLSKEEWYRLWHHSRRMTGGSLERDWYPETLQYLLSQQSMSKPIIQLIPAKREMGPSGGELTDLSGRGLIDRLAQIQSPDHDKRHERSDFDKINLFLQKVTGSSDATIEIPHNRQHVLVHMNNKVLPLSSLGTGIHEVIMIAAFCTLAKDQILCIEEPEIHLHPILQRKLIRFLDEFTDNQYFIATHSASFIDTPYAAIFHVINDGEQTRIKEAVLRSSRVRICTDLGYRASDIVQANYIIWVEGPSDRIYIRTWIAALDKTLIEGIHYSIMFYGGRLLSHLDADSDEITEFIALRSLNQNLAIVMDSDRASARAPINATKKRLDDQLGANGGISWITKGREIENYIEHAVLQGAVRTLYEKVYHKAASGGQFDHALYFERLEPKKRRRPASKNTEPGSVLEKDVDKVAVARLVCSQPLSLDVMDLRARIREIIDGIRSANF